MIGTTSSTRAYISNRFVLELDDGGMKYMGTLQSVDGGGLKSDAVEEKVGKDGHTSRHPGRPKYDDVTIQVGMAMAPRFWKWIKASFNYEPLRYDGAIIALDYDNNERWRRTFKGALISEVQFPQLDGAAKEPAYLTVKFAVESVSEEQKGKGGKYKPEEQSQGEWDKQRLWLPSNFAFKIDQFPQDSLTHAKVDGFTVKQNIITTPVGGFLVADKEPGRVEFPNLSVTVLQRDAQPWTDWYNKYVRDGHYEREQEKTGHVMYLGRDLDQGKPLLTLDIYGMGILAVTPVKHDAKQDGMQKVKIDLFCESMDIDLGKGAVS